MAYQPYDPFRGRTYRSKRRRPPAALALIAVLPALLVTMVVLWQWRGGEDPSNPSVAAAATQQTEAAGTEGTATLTSGAATTATPTPEPTEMAETAPQSLGLPPPDLSASAAIVVDDASMEVLFGLDAYTPRPPASITKMATAVVAMEHGRLDEVVTSEVHYWDMVSEADSTTMGLHPGDEVTLRELLYGLLLVSGNDAARMIADHVAGSDEAFVAKMNELAERLGMEDTHFVTVDGLSAPGHESSAWDLAVLSRYLMRFPDLRTIVGTEEHVSHGVREGEESLYYMYNHNPLLNYTPGVDGIKTGYTEEAGRTFAVTVEREGHRVFIVLLDSSARAQDSQALIEWAYENHVWPGEEVPPEAPEASSAGASSGG